MPPALVNRVRELREARGLSQLTLAEAARLSRQSLSAIEAGRTEPSVTTALRLATSLGCALEDLFVLGDERSVEAEVDPSGPRQPAHERVVLAQLAGRWVAHPLPLHDLDSATRAADGVLASAPRRGRARVELLRPSHDVRDTLVLLGCAPVLGLLADRVNQRARDLRVVWLSRSSGAALRALSSQRAHVAGVHFVDAQSGEYNVPEVRRSLPSRSVSLFNLARWEAGLVVAPHNPLGIRGLSDLTRPRVRLVAREAGAAARRLLEDKLRKARLPAADILRRARIVPSPLEVARAVALGAGDVGITMHSAALAFGLDFVPLSEERFDLVVPHELLTDARVVRLLDTLSSSGFRREMQSLGGYEVSAAGARVAEVRT